MALRSTPNAFTRRRLLVKLTASLGVRSADPIEMLKLGKPHISGYKTPGQDPSLDPRAQRRVIGRELNAVVWLIHQ